MVLNRGSSTATVLRARSDGGDDVATLDTADALNQLVLSPDGAHGVAFFDVNRSGGALGSSPSLQDVTLLTLQGGKERSVDLTVGFKPSSVQWAADGSKAFVVCEKSVSVIDPASATRPAIAPSVSLLRDPISEPAPAEVLVTPDGKLALVRQSKVKGLRAVNLATGALTDLALASEPTDLDLTEDGALAVAVLRDAGQVALIDVPGDLAAPKQIDLLSTGSYTAGQAVLTKDGTRAFLFSNATTQEVLLVADLVKRKLSVQGLQKGVRDVRAAPDGKTALVLHNRAPGSVSPLDSLEALIDKSDGYSLLSVPLGFAKLQLTETDPGESAFTADSAAAYVLLSDSATSLRAVEALDLKSFGIQRVTLGSPPVSVGVLGSGKKVYVAQDHALGRVTFLDVKSLKTETVTGFQLNSEIID